MWLALLFVLLASAELASAISIFVPGMGYVSTSDITFVYKTVEENLSCFLSKCVKDPKEKTVLKKKFEAAKPTQGFADYSAIIHTGSFSDLLCKGWNVTEKNSALTDNANKNMITFYGPFDSGKTYLASQLSEIPLPHGITAITDGISILIPSEGVDAYLDTAGYGRSDDPKQKGEREASEDFLQHVAVEAADRIVFVVGPLTRYDQDKFKEMLERISRTPGGCKAKPIYFVHNFKDYAFEEEVQLHIKNDIEKAFGAKKLTTKTGTVFYSSSYESEETCPNVAGSVFSCTITHIVMAMEGSDAGQIWNSNSITYLRALLTAPPSKRTVLTEIIKAAENLAPEKYMMVPPENRSPGTFGFILSETRIVTAGFLGEGVKFLMDYMADAIKKVLFPQKVPLLEFKVKYDSQSKLLKLHITEMSDKEVAEVCASNSIVPRHKSYKFTPTVSTWMYDDCKIIIVVELPGVDDSSVKVSPSFNSRGASLVISGVKDFPAHLISKCKLVSCPTSSIGPFSLMVDVPTSSNLATIDKKMENGILTIKLDVIGSSCKDEL